ncbi:hypothetical protein PR048_013078 [Dryococelus australis]|uniref:Uncharacterized protein n=1 Tax=Dryococelus australis TaxID=614101 RepID=A0ABQ9HS01_9NEOP|nr:hypothetical protein PR048_013078 [Dryococelus australis]
MKNDTNIDLFHKLLISSDPYTTSLSKSRKRTSLSCSTNVLQLLAQPPVPSYSDEDTDSEGVDSDRKTSNNYHDRFPAKEGINVMFGNARFDSQARYLNICFILEMPGNCAISYESCSSDVTSLTARARLMCHMYISVLLWRYAKACTSVCNRTNERRGVHEVGGCPWSRAMPHRRTRPEECEVGADKKLTGRPRTLIQPTPPPHDIFVIWCVAEVDPPAWLE